MALTSGTWNGFLNNAYQFEAAVQAELAVVGNVVTGTITVTLSDGTRYAITATGSVNGHQLSFSADPPDSGSFNGVWTNLTGNLDGNQQAIIGTSAPGAMGPISYSGGGTWLLFFKQ